MGDLSTVTVERLRDLLEDNERLAAGTTSADREELQRLLAENQQLRNAAGATAGTATRQRLDELARENAEMKLQITSSRTREAIRKMEAQTRALNIRDRQSNISGIIDQFRNTQRVDLCFLVDCTGSMADCIQEVKSKINNIVTEVTQSFPDVTIRLAFVGYRDICDGDLRFSVFNFNSTVQNFVNFVSNVSATGGGDTCEDVFGGLDKVNGLSWSSGTGTRIVVHFADAPCHGQEYHEGCNDSYTGGDPNGLSIRTLLNNFKSRNIQYWFVHLNESTRKMIRVFKSRSTLVIHELNMSDGFTSMVSDMTETLCESIMTVDKMTRPKGGRHVVFSNLSSISESSSILEYSIDQRYPTSFMSFPVIKYQCQEPASDADIYKNLTIEPTNTVTLQVARQPFAEGASRICYYGLDQFGRKIVLKEFKDTLKNTKRDYKAMIESSMIANYLAKKFTEKITRRGYQVQFLLPELVETKYPNKTPSRSTSYFCIETQNAGEYKKFNNNCGYVSHRNNQEVLNAFSHWTHSYTGGVMMVVDLQGEQAGFTFTLTDPAIHCEESQGEAGGLLRFGSSNLGKRGMTQFFKTHSCKDICRSQGMLLYTIEECELLIKVWVLILAFICSLL